jgi:acetyl-CoA carboxylase biotin carboxyl carrier protein
VTLTAAEVAEIMRLVEQSTFDELCLEMDGIQLTLRRTGASGKITRTLTTPTAHADGAAADAAASRSAAVASRSGAASAPRAVRAAPGPVDANLKEITSPMLGTFYRAPKPGSAPFVEVGSAVDEDSVIAIIEVMKLMNTVRAGVKGVITEILPVDESLVEFGEVLMRAQTGA